MKRLLAILFLFPLLLHADQSVTLAWDPNPEPDVSSEVTNAIPASVTNQVGPRKGELYVIRGTNGTAPVFGMNRADGTNFTAMYSAQVLGFRPVWELTRLTWWG